jgi:7-keto-8-aminopelargonate synthetase-like enzyme
MTRLAISRSTATTVEIDGRELLYFGGCGYLGLAHHPEVVRALQDGLAKYGVSSGASRETTGNTIEHYALESELAQWLGCEAVVLTPDGYTANFAATLGAMSHSGLTTHVDENAHPSLLDAGRARGSHFVFPLGDLAAASNKIPLFFDALILSDSVFPSLGVVARMRELATAVQRGGGVLVLDDAHGTGVIGATGRGALEQSGLRANEIVLTSTLSKAIGCYGGFVAATSKQIEQIREHASAYHATTPIPPAVAAAARVALRLAFGTDELLRRLRANIQQFRSRVDGLFTLPKHEELPVFAFALESPAKMQSVHDALLAEGILAPYVRYHGGPASGYFRIVVTAAHDSEQIDRLSSALQRHLGASP